MTDQNKKPDDRQVRVEIDDAVADGHYANLAFIATGDSEFIFDFARFLPGNKGGKVVTRVILGPRHAKGFLASLSQAIERYEQKFGVITPEAPSPSIRFPMNPDDLPSA